MIQYSTNPATKKAAARDQYSTNPATKKAVDRDQYSTNPETKKARRQLIVINIVLIQRQRRQEGS